METENTGTTEFNLSTEADKIIASSESENVSSSESSEVSGDTQETAPQENTNEVKELSAEEILGQVTSEKVDPKANEEILNAINSIGAIHNGQPVKIESVDQLKEIVQKGFDYTKKTMAHAEEVKAFTDQKAKIETEWKAKEEQYAQRETELAEVITENNIATSVLREMQSTDPELFNEFKLRFEAEIRRQEAAMPFMKQFENQFQGLQKEIQTLKNGKTNEELEAIKNTWSTELTATQNKYAPVVAKLGVKIDWDKVKNVWSSDATGKMTVEQALNAVHGSDFNKAFTSHQKLLATKQKTANAMLKRTGVGGSVGSKDESNKNNMDIGSYIRSVAESI
jgi:hypothetical protein